MPWKEVSAMSLRGEFVLLASAEGADMSALCRRFGVSRKTGYKWLARAGAEGVSALADRSRRPHHSPRHTSPSLERRIVAARRAHPAWGGRKIRAWLIARGGRVLPAPSTITDILRRHELLDAERRAQQTPPQRFERAHPNELWQMDFKGHFAIDTGRCHPLGVLDDHSRYNICLKACANERRGTVKAALTQTFRRYGLPEAMLMDHGPPWGYDPEHPYTRLAVWLLRLGIHVLHGRPRHPQTQGKQERFHRTLQIELLQGRRFASLIACQRAFDHWRDQYNLERPHEALAMQPPISRYRGSPRAFPETLPAIEYADTDTLCRVGPNGEIKFQQRLFDVTRALKGERVAVRALTADGRYGIYYAAIKLREIDMWEGG
jgi:transposase InsO family protein